MKDSIPVKGDGLKSDLSLKGDAEAAALYLLLADTYGLYLKTQNFHWNVVGKDFAALHRLFEGQYKDLAEATDEIAERIRTLGFFVDGRLAAFAEKSSVATPTKPPEAEKMVQELAKDHEAMAEKARRIYKSAAAKGDSATESLAGHRVAVHEKTAWMLRSSR